VLRAACRSPKPCGPGANPGRGANLGKI